MITGSVLRSSTKPAALERLVKEEDKIINFI
jgi:hypothetical protein